MPPTGLPSPSISNFGHTSTAEPFIQFANSLPDYLQNLSTNHTFMSLLYFLWAFFVILIGAIAWVVWKTMSMQAKEYKDYYENAAKRSEPESVVRKRSEAWKEIASHLKSDNEADWKIAILEADSILGELLDDLGYQGENLGDKLKAIPKGEILSLDNAWAAHKMRNRIAHEGTTMKLSRKEFGDTLTNFELVFREFNYI